VAAGPPQQTDQNFRFGPFELLEREGELRKNGLRIKLQDHPLRVLLELVANAGRVVTREELHQKDGQANAKGHHRPRSCGQQHRRYRHR